MEELKLTFVNVGYGEAMVLECPDPAFPGGTFVMVIVGGSAEPEEYQGSGTGRIPLDQYLSLGGVDHICLWRTVCAPAPSGRRCRKICPGPCASWRSRRSG